MELRYPIKVLYTLGSSQLMLARADDVECRAVKPRPNSNNGVKHASTTLKACLGALCAASPELLADPRTDHSVYALDPLQSPELMVGRGLLTWLMAESGRVVGIVKEDYVDGEEMDVLEVRLSLTPTVAVSRAQHATSLHNISHSNSTSANPSPPTTPLTQPTTLQPTRTSTRIRIRAKKEASTTPPPPAPPPKRGRPKRTASPSAQTPLETQPTSPGPSRTHSRVSSVSSLALSQTQPPVSQSRPPLSSASQPRSSQPPVSRNDSQPASPARSLARLLASSGALSGTSASGTPLLDSLMERLKAAGLLSTLQAAGLASGSGGESQGDVKLEDVSETQRQALLTLLKLATSGSSSDKERGTDESRKSSSSYSKSSAGVAPSPAAFAAPSPRIAAPSPAPFSAPSPAASTAPRPLSSVSGDPPVSRSDSTLGVRKRELDDGEIVEIDPSEYTGTRNEAKRARVGVDDAMARTGNANLRSVSTGDLGFGNATPSPSLSATSPQFSATPSALSPDLSAASPNISAAVASPGVSASPNIALPSPSPNIAAPSPAVSAASPNFAAPSPAPSISPAISAASPYPYPYPTSSSQPLGPPRVLTATVSQPNLSFSQLLLPQSSSQPSSSQLARKRGPRATPLTAQTDLPPWSGSFITPREQIGQPRVPAEVPPPARKCVPGPGRAKAPGAKKKEEAARKVRGVSEEEVREMLAGGYYPSGGLQDEHRRLFGAGGSRGGRPATGATAGDEESEVDDAVKVDPAAGATPSSAPTSTQAPNPAAASSHYRSNSTAPPPAPPPPRPRQPRAPTKTPRQRPPTIPKRSPVALPAISRLPMMMTSPIRATGAPDPGRGHSSLAASLSLSEYSPLKRLLKNAGVDKIEDVLGRGGVLGLKGSTGWRGAKPDTTRASGKAEMIREQEREVVDLTSDADDDEPPPPVQISKPTRKRPRTPPQSGPSLLAVGRTPTPRRPSPYVAVTPPRKAHTSPPRLAESPLFNATVPQFTSSDAPGDPTTSEGIIPPLDLPPSSPPPMSDSDLEAGSGLENGGQEYRETAQGYSSDAPVPGLGLEVGTEDEDDGGWDETIRPAEPATADVGENEPVGSILGVEELGILSSEADLGLGLPATGDQQLDLETLSSLLNMLGTQPATDGSEANVETDLNAVLTGTEVSALDFSWLDALGSEAGQGETGDVGVDFNLSEGTGLDEHAMQTSPDTEGGMTEAELAQILAAFGS